MFKLYIFFNEIVDIELSSIIILLDIIHVIIYKGIKLKTISAFIRIRWFNKWNIEKIIKFQSKILRTFKKKIDGSNLINQHFQKTSYFSFSKKGKIYRPGKFSICNNVSHVDIRDHQNLRKHFPSKMDIISQRSIPNLIIVTFPIVYIRPHRQTTIDTKTS